MSAGRAEFTPTIERLLALGRRQMESWDDPLLAGSDCGHKLEQWQRRQVVEALAECGWTVADIEREFRARGVSTKWVYLSALSFVLDRAQEVEA